MYYRWRASLEEVNGMETVLEIPATGVALSEPLAAPAESLPLWLATQLKWPAQLWRISGPAIPGSYRAWSGS
jgi:hypothetical protein